jgi:hypothetical protein
MEAGGPHLTPGRKPETTAPSQCLGTGRHAPGSSDVMRRLSRNRMGTDY